MKEPKTAEEPKRFNDEELAEICEGVEEDRVRIVRNFLANFSSFYKKGTNELAHDIMKLFIA